MKIPRHTAAFCLGCGEREREPQRVGRLRQASERETARKIKNKIRWFLQLISSVYFRIICAIQSTLTKVAGKQSNKRGAIERGRGEANKVWNSKCSSPLYNSRVCLLAFLAATSNRFRHLKIIRFCAGPLIKSICCYSSLLSSTQLRADVDVLDHNVLLADRDTFSFLSFFM